MDTKFVNEITDLPLPPKNVWADYVFRPLILTVMISCISLSLITLGRSLAPDWWGGYLLLGVILATVESIYSFRILRLPHSRGISMARYRLSEWGTLAILLKIVTYIGRPWAEIWSSVELLIRLPQTLFTLDYIVMLGLALAAWWMAYGTLLDFEALYDPYTFRAERILPVDRLAARFFWGGGIIILATGLSFLVSETGWAGFMKLVSLDHARVGGVVLNVLVYFILGLIMLSQVRLTTLTTRWYIQQITITGGLGKRWARYGLAFLGIVTLMIIFLPTSYSLGLYDTAMLGFGFLFEFILGIAQLVMLLLTLPLAWLASLFGGDGPASPTGGMGAGPLAPPVGDSGPPPPWLEILRSLVFWLVFTFAAIYLIRSYLADHPELIDSLKRFKPIRWLFGLLVTLFVWLIQFIRTGISLIPKQIDIKPSVTAKKAPLPKAKWRLPRLGSASNRERVLYYYLNTLQRAEAIGLTRKRYQTPYEFEPQLGSSIPDVDADVDLLTKAFVHARYSQDQFDKERADLIKTVWQRIRSALRELKKQQVTKS